MSRRREEDVTVTDIAKGRAYDRDFDLFSRRGYVVCRVCSRV